MPLLRNIIALVILSISSITAVQAVPLYYTFQGTATSVNDLTGASNTVVGDALEYVFLIDFDLGGMVTLNNGITSSIVDAFSLYEPSVTYNAAIMNNFYVDYLFGDAYFGTSGVNNNFTELNTGVDNSGLGKYMITGGDAIGIAGFTNAVADWSIGDMFYSLNVWGDLHELINGNVTLVSISDTIPASVPEPSSLLLLGLGLAGLRVRCRKK